jgi:uracil phosphoribosyltransferase
MDHPLILHKISLLRAKETNTKDFRQLIHEIALLIGYEATRDLPVTECTVTTLVADAVGYRLPRQVCLVPILRAGLGMVDALLSLIPAAKVGHIGLSRDPATLNPVEYCCKMPPDVAERAVLVLDPMLATGGSAAAAITFLKKRGAKNIRMLNIIGAPEGSRRSRKPIRTWTSIWAPWTKS